MSSVASKHYLHNEEVAFNGGSNRVYTGCFEVTIKLPVKKAFSTVFSVTRMYCWKDG